MSKLEHVANLRRELAVLLDEMMEESALALFARWMLEGRSIPAHTSGSGNAAKREELRKMHSLLADFIKGPALPAASAAVPTEQPGKTRGSQRGVAEGPDGAGLPGRNGDLAAKEHVPPHRGDARSERRLERRGSRHARSSPRPPAETP